MSTEMEKQKTEAEEALQKADAVTLKRLFDHACHNIEVLVDGFDVMCRHGDTIPRANDIAITAMRDVAIAAIALARQVSLPGPPDELKRVK